MKLPIDFEEKVKMPPQVNGQAYPYQISANHLMQNFRYSALQVDKTPASGLNLTEKITLNGERTVGLTGSINNSITHPWKCLDSNTSFVAVAAGKIFGARSPGFPPETPYYVTYVSYSGGSIEITSASGYIYAVISVTQEDIYQDGATNTISFTHLPSSVSVMFSVDDPNTISSGASGEIYWPIAQVETSGAGVIITDQILTHNPTVSFEAVVALS